MNMFMIYISAMYETRMLLTCFMVVGRFKNLRRKLGDNCPAEDQRQAYLGASELNYWGNKCLCV